MAEQMSGLDMVREIIGQINNLRRLITFQGKTYKLNTKTGNYEADGRSFTKDQLKSKLQGQSYKAPKVRKNLKIKNQTNTKTTPKTSVKTKVSKAANNVKKVAKNLKIKNIPKGSLVKGVKTLGAGVVADWATNQVVDRAFRQLAGKSNMTLDEFRAERDKNLKEARGKGAKRVRRRPTGAERNKIIAARKRVTTTDDYGHGRRKTYKGKTTYWNKNTKSWQTNKPGPFIKKSSYQSTPPTSTKPTRSEELKKGMATWRVDSEEQKKLNKGKTGKNIKIKTKKTDKKDSGGNTGGTTTTVTKSKLTPAQKEERAKNKWLEKTRNSPAQKSGAFDPKKLWELHKHHQGFKKARKEGTLKEWRKKNKKK